jgi:crotonobetainyl-CoA:carnitine CoA-transferase CaiB-like acyl-CoA transferase
MSDRNYHREALISDLSAIFQKRSTADWLLDLADSDVPNGSLNSYDKVFEHPQVIHRELKVKQIHANGGEVTTVRNPIRMSVTPIENRYAPPVRGEHTMEVLGDLLELSQQDVEKLQEQRVIEIMTKGQI